MLTLWLKMKLFWALRKNAMRVARLFLDRRVHPGLKLLTALAGIIIVSPVDLFADVPGLGVVDDTLLLALLAWIFVRFCPPHIVAEYFGARGAGQLKNVTP
jgi:uncharacterized membrane protein YkvA (DUF1232 family)